MSVPESKLSPRVLAAQAKEAQALDLRLAGYTFDAIAAQLGYASRSSAYRAVSRGLQHIRGQADQTADQLRQLEDARYDRMLRAIDDKVQQGDVAAIDRALRISKARRELWGLDAPVQIQEEVSPVMARLMAEWQQLRDHPETPPVLPPYDIEGETPDESADGMIHPPLLRPPPAADELDFGVLDRANMIAPEEYDEGEDTDDEP